MGLGVSATDDLCRSYLDLKWHFDPAGASAAGLASHDARLGSFDADTVRRHLAALRALAAAVEEADVATLDEEIDRTALLDELRATVHRLEGEKPHVRNPGFWIGHLFEGLYALLVRRGDGGFEARAGAAIDRLRGVPALLDAARATLEAPPSVFVDSALQMLGGGGELIARMAQRLGDAAPERAADAATAAREALEALAAFGRALSTDIAPSDDPHAFAIGERAFERRLHEEHALGAGPGELWRYGQHLQEEVEQAIAALARRIDPARPWREVVERIREETLPPESLLDGYRTVTERALALIRERDLATIPDGPVAIEATPPFLKPLTPFAAYQPPPVYLPDRTGDFFVTLPDPGAPPAATARLLRDHAHAGIPSTVAHEAYPGHHLHLLAMQGLGSEVRRHLWSPVTVEGWALYSEELMDAAGFYPRPEERLLRLVNLLWRAVRIELDIGLHTRGMTPADAAARLAGRIPMERSAAEAEVRRYCAWPTYQLCYAVGRREILVLRDRWRARAGADAPLRAFHDALHSYGGLPVSLASWGLGLDEG
jgi:uncharacterized protein (DUF885 family)